LLTTERHADVEGARRATFEAGARAGLVACGDVAMAIRETARATEVELSGDPTALASQLATVDALTRVVRFALGPYAD
ncbi:MAG: hypothetical protein K8H88_28220, partial [Sandaracinaceae bacterium]|nr:hypothetical protein [Sandaracinaceae bacterium]